MTLKIANNIPAMNAHRYLLNTDKAINRTLEKISTGLEIVRAADGPADLILSEQIRSQISGLKQAVRNSEVAISMVQTTEGAMEEATKLITDLRRLAVHASNDAVNDKYMLQADQDEVNYILEALQRIATNTTFGDKKLLDGSNKANGVAVGAGLEFVAAGRNTKSSGPAGYDVYVEEPATYATLKSNAFNSDDFAKGTFVPGEEKYITIQKGGKSISVQVGEGDTAYSVVCKLNNEFVANGLELEASKDDNNVISIVSKDCGSGQGFTGTTNIEGFYDEVDKPKEALDGTDIVASFGVKDAAGKVTKYPADGKCNVITGKDCSPTEGLEVRYTEPAEGPPSPEESVGKVIVNQNPLTFQVGANAGNFVQFDLASILPKDLAKGIKNESGFKSIKDIDLRTFQGAQDALKLVVAASNDINVQRGKLGALQKQNLEPTTEYVRNLVENMSFADSTIRDADIAEKTAELVKRQIQAQTSASAQVHASNSPKIVQQLVSSVTPTA